MVEMNNTVATIILKDGTTQMALIPQTTWDEAKLAVEVIFSDSEVDSAWIGPMRLRAAPPAEMPETLPGQEQGA